MKSLVSAFIFTGLTVTTIAQENIEFGLFGSTSVFTSSKFDITKTAEIKTVDSTIHDVIDKAIRLKIEAFISEGKFDKVYSTDGGQITSSEEFNSIFSVSDVVQRTDETTGELITETTTQQNNPSELGTELTGIFGYNPDIKSWQIQPIAYSYVTKVEGNSELYYPLFVILQDEKYASDAYPKLFNIHDIIFKSNLEEAFVFTWNTSSKKITTQSLVRYSSEMPRILVGNKTLPDSLYYSTGNSIGFKEAISYEVSTQLLNKNGNENNTTILEADLGEVGLLLELNSSFKISNYIDVRLKGILTPVYSGSGDLVGHNSLFLEKQN